MSLDPPKIRPPHPMLWLKVGWLICAAMSLWLSAYLLTSFDPGLARAPDRHGYGALMAFFLLANGVAAAVAGAVAAVVGIALPGGQWTRKLTLAIAVTCLSAQVAMACTLGLDDLLAPEISWYFNLLAASPGELCLATIVIMCLPSVRNWYAFGSPRAKKPAVSEYTRHRS